MTANKNEGNVRRQKENGWSGSISDQRTQSDREEQATSTGVAKLPKVSKMSGTK